MTTELQTEREILDHIRAIVDYNMPDELRDFEEWTRSEDAGGKHIYNSLVEVDGWLAQQGA